MIGDDLTNFYNDNFRPVNKLLKRVITDWQVTPLGEPNNHVDWEYDNKVLDRFDRVHNR